MAKTLNVEDVFLSKNPELSGDKPHYHIVIHKTEDNKVVVVYTTSNIERVKRKCRKLEDIKFDYIDPDGCVVINNNHCDALDHDSAIDCNQAQLKPITYFTEKQYFKKCQPVKDPAVIPKIKKAMKESKIVTEIIQKLL